MVVQASVIVDLDQQAASLHQLTRALDAQSLPPAQFEVVLLAGRADEAARARADDLARRRPNVQVTIGTIEDAIAASAADWIMVLDNQEVSLRGGALERLIERGTAASSDLVLGRVDLDGGRELNDVLAHDGDGVTVTPDVLAAAVVLQRRTHALEHGAATGGAGERVLATNPTVATLGSYQCASRPTSPRTGDLAPITVDATQARWDDAELVLEVQGRAEGADGGEVTMYVRSGALHDDHPLRVDGTVESDGRFRATTRLAPASAAGGEPLPVGRWTVTVGVHGPALRWSRRRNILRVEGLQHAVIAGQPVSVDNSGAHLVLDVGATKTSLVGQVPAGDVTISEDYRGTLFRARLPRVTTPVADRLIGKMLLGSFDFPAAVVEVEGAVHLECFLSALTGRAPLASRFGTVTAPLGLDLVVSPTGEMSVERHVPKPKPKPAAKPAGAKPAPARKAAARKTPARTPTPAAPRSTVQRIRHALPKSLDPLIASVARRPAVARLYRKAAGLSGR